MILATKMLQTEFDIYLENRCRHSRKRANFGKHFGKQFWQHLPSCWQFFLKFDTPSCSTRRPGPRPKSDRPKLRGVVESSTKVDKIQKLSLSSLYLGYDYGSLDKADRMNTKLFTRIKLFHRKHEENTYFH